MTGRKRWVEAEDGSVVVNTFFVRPGPDTDYIQDQLPDFLPLVKMWVLGCLLVWCAAECICFAVAAEPGAVEARGWGQGWGAHALHGRQGPLLDAGHPTRACMLTAP